MTVFFCYVGSTENNHMPYVYILANRRNGALYIGVTNDIIRRIHEHKDTTHKGFPQRYAINKLVWYELFDTFEEAISCEKRLKKWHRKWKVDLITKINPMWTDLSLQLTD